MLKYFVQSFFLLCFLQEGLKGQEGKPWIFRARVKDCMTGQSIPYADIYNESARKGIFTDSSGLFRIHVRVGDTLVIQSMGYFGKVYVIHERVSNTIETLELCSQLYELGEIQIDLPHSYKEFQKRFLEIEPERGLQIEGLPKAKIQDIPSLLDTNYLNSNHFAIFSPINYLYYKYSKEEKSKRKVFYLERQKREQLIIDKKYNLEMIEQITGLKGDEITDFMAFCNFSHQFLYEATDLEIVQEINRKYTTYSNRDKSLKP